MWRGEWEWEDYDREKEWDAIKKRLRDERNTPPARSSALGGHVPQEILLGMVREMEVVSTCVLSMSLLHTELLC